LVERGFPMTEARERDRALLRGQRRVLELVTRGAPLRDTLTALCEMIEERLPCALCSVLLLDARAGALHHGAAPRLPKVYCDAIDGAHIGPRVGSCGTAAFERRAVTVEDIAQDPLWADFREVALPHALAACASTPIFDAQSEVLGTFAIYHQEPGPFDAEELALLHDVSGLATLVIESDRRDAALRASEEVVRQIQKLDSLGVLAGGIAHDFNNLLATMLGNLNLAEMALSAVSPAMPYLETLEVAVLRAADLTKQMLAYSGKGRFVIKGVDLSQLVQEVAHLLEVALPKTVALRFLLAPNLPIVEADVAQLQQVVMNLVTNAAEAIGDRDGTVSVTTGVIDIDGAYIATAFDGQPVTPGRYVTLEVSDTGCGIAPDILPKIFEPFFTTKSAGRGLGLCAMLGILRGHRAGLEIYSEPGEGSTFKVYFPASVHKVDQAPLPASTAPIVRPGGVALVVDDEPPLRRVLSLMLSELGFEVMEAANGLEATALVQEHRSALTLVLMDMTMPKMNGREAFSAISSIDPTIPVILCSGYDEQETIQHFLGKGLAGFLQKPFGHAALEDAVRAALATRAPP
jgi:signal transduction histidine kinase/CheY-like chemotaxis protein